MSWLSPNYNVLMQIYPLAVLIFHDVIYIGPMSIVVCRCGLMCHILVAVLVLVQSCDIFFKIVVYHCVVLIYPVTTLACLDS